MAKIKMGQCKVRKPFQLNMVAVALILLSLTMLTIGGGFAKYVYNQQAGGSLVMPEFYFTSDILMPGGAEYTLNTNHEGKASVTFELRNFIDEFRYSEQKITYTCEVSDADVVIKYKDAEHELLGGQATSTSITLDNLKAGQTYIVTVTGTAIVADGNGFVQTLQATFVVHDEQKNIYKHVEFNDYYVLLTVWTENLMGDVNISFPTNLIPDNTDPVMAEIDNYDEGSDSYLADSLTDQSSFQTPFSSYTYRFFKANSSDGYNVGQFTVVLGDNEAEPSNPK